MIDLVQPEFLDRCLQFRVVIGEHRRLVGVMLLDHLLDRDGARHRGLAAQ